MYRVRSRSLITKEIIDSEHTLPTKEDAESVVSFFNSLYKHLFQYWVEPVQPEPTLENIKEYYLF